MKHVLEGIGSYVSPLVRPYESKLVKLLLPHSMRTRLDAPVLYNRPRIVRHVAQARIESLFRSHTGGVDVIVAPPGSGKSMNLRYEFNAFLDGGGTGVFFEKLKSEDHFYSAFSGGLRRRDDLFRILPHGSVIVMDQFEQKSDEIFGLITTIMTQSMIMGNASVIVATSSVEIAQKLLNLNGGRKISRAGAPLDFKWTAAEVDQFMEGLDVSHTGLAASALRELACKAACPGFLVDVARKKEKADWVSESADYASAWDDFSTWFPSPAATAA